MLKGKRVNEKEELVEVVVILATVTTMLVVVGL